MKRMTALLLAVMCVCGCFLFASCGNKEEEQITPVSFDILKIGKADCIVINTGNKIVMIDTGHEEDFYRVRSYMSIHGYDTIDALILTHSDKDHIGGAASVIKEYNVTNVIESHIVTGKDEYEQYHALLEQKGISPVKLSQPYSFTYDNCEFIVDVPQRKRYPEKHDNNASLIVSMQCGESRFLFCGDAMELRLAEWMQNNENNTKYDFVKLPYHGNYLKNYKEFLEKVGAQYAAITCSKNNPAQSETLAVLEEYGVAMYVTTNGQIGVTSDGKTVTVTQG